MLTILDHQAALLDHRMRDECLGRADGAADLHACGRGLQTFGDLGYAGVGAVEGEEVVMLRTRRVAVGMNA